jgi:hypothetical protein
MSKYGLKPNIPSTLQAFMTCCGKALRLFRLEILWLKYIVYLGKFYYLQIHGNEGLELNIENPVVLSVTALINKFYEYDYLKL